MKIFFVTNLRLPNERGVSYGVVVMCRALAAAGAEVELVAPQCRPVSQITGDIWQYHQIDPGLFKLTRLPHLELPLPHLQYALMAWSFSFLAFFYLLRSRAKFVHVFNDAKELLFLLKLSGWWYRPKIVYEVHMLPVGWYDRFLERLAIGRVNLILVTTHHFAEFYKDKTLVFPNGIDLNEFDYLTPIASLRRELKLPAAGFLVGYSGRFTTMGMEKGIPELIKAVAKLIKKYPDLFLVCVGGTVEQIEKYQLDAKASKLPAKRAIFIGDVTRKTLYRYMRAFDICAMPFPNLPHYAVNMSPLKMFEYMAAKKPIIASDLPSIKEVLRDGCNALLVKPGDSGDLAAKIEMLYKNRSLSNYLATSAFREVKIKYQWVDRGAEEIRYLENTK